MSTDRFEMLELPHIINYTTFYSSVSSGASSYLKEGSIGISYRARLSHHPVYEDCLLIFVTAQNPSASVMEEIMRKEIEFDLK